MSSPTKFKSRSFEDLFKDGWSAELLSQKIDELIDAYPLPSLPGNDMGSPEQWIEIYLASPGSGRVIFDSSDRMVAFWHCVPVRSDTYDKILAGANVNKHLSTTDLELAEPADGYSLYFVDLFVSIRTRAIGLMRALFESFADYLFDELTSGRTIRRIAAHVSSREAERLCSGLGFKLVSLHREHRILADDDTLMPTKIYEIQFEKGGAEMLIDRFRKLRDQEKGRVPPTMNS